MLSKCRKENEFKEVFEIGKQIYKRIKKLPQEIQIQKSSKKKTVKLPHLTKPRTKVVRIFEKIFKKRKGELINYDEDKLL